MQTAEPIPVADKELVDSYLANISEEMLEDPSTSPIWDIRNEMMEQVITQKENYQYFNGPTMRWGDSSCGGKGVRLHPLANRVLGRPVDALLDPMIIDDATAFLEELPITDNIIRAGKMWRYFNQQVYIKGTGKETITVYRGIHGEYARDILKEMAEKKTDLLRIPVRPLQSETTREELAGYFGGSAKNSLLYSREVKVTDNLWDSHITNPHWYKNEQEIITCGGSHIDVKVIAHGELTKMPTVQDGKKRRIVLPRPLDADEENKDWLQQLRKGKSD